MKADEINSLATLIAKCLSEKCSNEELIKISALISQIGFNIQTYIKFPKK